MKSPISPIVILIAGWLVPGAGHFLLRKWGRGILLLVSIIAMFSIGISLQAAMINCAQSCRKLAPVKVRDISKMGVGLISGDAIEPGARLILWLSLKTRRWLGLGALSLGAGVLLGIYFWLVP